MAYTSRHIGGKAANFGFLRRTVPDNSPEAIAFTFDLWDQFMISKWEIKRSRRKLAQDLNRSRHGPRILQALIKLSVMFEHHSKGF